MPAIPPSFPAMVPLLVIFKNLRRLMRSISLFLPCDPVSFGHPSVGAEIIVRCQVTSTNLLIESGLSPIPQSVGSRRGAGFASSDELKPMATQTLERLSVDRRAPWWRRAPDPGIMKPPQAAVPKYHGGAAVSVA